MNDALKRRPGQGWLFYEPLEYALPKNLSEFEMEEGLERRPSIISAENCETVRLEGTKDSEVFRINFGARKNSSALRINDVAKPLDENLPRSRLAAHYGLNEGEIG